VTDSIVVSDDSTVVSDRKHCMEDSSTSTVLPLEAVTMSEGRTAEPDTAFSAAGRMKCTCHQHNGSVTIPYTFQQCPAHDARRTTPRAEGVSPKP
jgi:hypothetical protein